MGINIHDLSAVKTHDHRLQESKNLGQREIMTVEQYSRGFIVDDLFHTAGTTANLHH
jgi:hypothetical protein